MTDKQIIIDGVDVVKCRNFTSKWDFNNCGHICKGTECKYKRLWYKKQLARKEQELKNICKAFDIEYLIDKETGNLIGRCNKLYKKEQECEALQMSENEAGEIIAELKAYKDVNEDFKTAWEELKAENEELKNKLHKNFEEKDKLHLIIDRLLEASGYYTNTASAEDFEDVYENMRYEKQQLDQLKQTITEIKEITEVEIECKTYEIENDCFNETRCKALNEHIDFIKQILQKISECEVENE